MSVKEGGVELFSRWGIIGGGWCEDYWGVVWGLVESEEKVKGMFYEKCTYV